MGRVVEVFVMEEFSNQLTNHLQNCCSQTMPGRPAARPGPASSILPPAEEESHIAILDTGASRTVIGERRLERLLMCLKSPIRKQVPK